MKLSNWHIITGAPSSGKSTLITQLATMGFKIAPEIARPYIEGLLVSNPSLDEIYRNTPKLQRGILAAALKRERQLDTDELIFFDRGTSDSLGYFNYYNLDARTASKICHHVRYKRIFFCHQLPVVPDTVRIEDNTTALKIGKLIFKAYQDAGYEIIEIPALSVSQRIDIILTYLD
ncbi:MAG TPA: ATP-binding protein [Legionella sp.]|nr:ATP-binding protein [Legionella sp.]